MGVPHCGSNAPWIYHTGVYALGSRQSAGAFAWIVAVAVHIRGRHRCCHEGIRFAGARLSVGPAGDQVATGMKSSAQAPVPVPMGTYLKSADAGPQVTNW